MINEQVGRKLSIPTKISSHFNLVKEVYFVSFNLTCSLVQHITLHILSPKPLLNKYKSYSFTQTSFKELNTYTNLKLLSPHSLVREVNQSTYRKNRLNDKGKAVQNFTLKHT